jgi:glycosyltransferase involved in cell wall biosynthesis
MSPSPLHIVVYTDSAGIGGAEISLAHLVATASDAIRVTVVGVAVNVVDAIGERRPDAARYVLPAKGLRAWISHWQTFQNLRPDIIHINLCTPWAGTIGLSTAIALAQLHSEIRVIRVDQLPLRTTDALTLWRTRALSLRVDAHVAVGVASCRRMEDFYALGRDSLISIPNGVPDRVFLSSIPQGSSESSSSKSITVGSIGRLDAMKAHDVLLRAVAQVEGVRAVILGEGAERAALEKLALDLDIQDRVELPGWVSDPSSYLPSFDVVALPSRSEGFPLAMVEAMLAARPVVATRIGSMPEAVIDDETGILIEKNDVDGLASALRRLRDDPALRARLGNQARQLAKAQFTVEAMTARYESLWRQVRSRPSLARLQVPRPKD